MRMTIVQIIWAVCGIVACVRILQDLRVAWGIGFGGLLTWFFLTVPVNLGLSMLFAWGLSWLVIHIAVRSPRVLDD